MSTSSAPGSSPSRVRFDVLGVRVDAVDLTAAADRIEGWIAGGTRSYVCHANVHGVMEARRDAHVGAAYDGAGLTVADGMPLVWLGRRSGHAGTGRVYGPDLMLELCARAARTGASSFYFGGAPGVAQALAAALSVRFPGLRTAGTHAPPFGLDGRQLDREAVAAINRAKPDIVWVGLGCPRQELWMATHRRALEAGVLIGVGAAFDFHTGRVPQAPRAMQAAGLEWLFRLAQEPRRLWYRYLVYNPLFVGLLALEKLGLRRRAASHHTAAAARAETTSDVEKPGGR